MSHELISLFMNSCVTNMVGMKLMHLLRIIKQNVRYIIQNFSVLEQVVLMHSVLSGQKQTQTIGLSLHLF